MAQWSRRFVRALGDFDGLWGGERIPLSRMIIVLIYEKSRLRVNKSPQQEHHRVHIQQDDARESQLVSLLWTAIINPRRDSRYRVIHGLLGGER